MSIVQVAYVNSVRERLESIAKEHYLELYTKYYRDSDYMKLIFYDPISAKCSKIEIDLIKFNDKEEEYAAIVKELQRQNLVEPTTSTKKQVWISTGRSGGKDYWCKMANNYINANMSVYSMYPNGLLRKENAMILPKIEKVIFNDPATIVKWSDGTKTVVKAENEPYDEEKGLAMVITKKALGNQGNYYEVFKKWLPEEKLTPPKHPDKCAEYNNEILPYGGNKKNCDGNCENCCPVDTNNKKKAAPVCREHCDGYRWNFK